MQKYWEKLRGRHKPILKGRFRDSAMWRENTAIKFLGYLRMQNLILFIRIY